MGSSPDTYKTYSGCMLIRLSPVSLCLSVSLCAMFDVFWWEGNFRVCLLPHLLPHFPPPPPPSFLSSLPPSTAVPTPSSTLHYTLICFSVPFHCLSRLQAQCEHSHTIYQSVTLSHPLSLLSLTLSLCFLSPPPFSRTLYLFSSFPISLSTGIFLCTLYNVHIPVFVKFLSLSHFVFVCIFYMCKFVPAYPLLC